MHHLLLRITATNELLEYIIDHVYLRGTKATY